LAALEDHADLRLAAGDHHAVAADLAVHVRGHPLRERPAAQLILALYRAGRPSEALAAYQDTRRVMIAELGIEPGAELRSLHQAVLVKDPVLDLASPAQQVTVSKPYLPAELPADTDAFTARTAEINRLRTVLGPAGSPAHSPASERSARACRPSRDGVVTAQVSMPCRSICQIRSAASVRSV
jgi:hypothetical protein